MTQIYGPLMLMPWQLAVVGYAGGLLAWSYPWPVLVSLGLAGVICARGRMWIVLLLAAGIGLALGAPPVPVANPWDKTVRVRGVVDEVRTHPGQRISLVVSRVTDAASGQILPGRLLWSWQNPPTIPLVGQEFATRLRIRELRGRANFGLSSSEEHWHRQGVYHRAFTRGQADVSWGSPVRPVRGALMDLVASLVPEGVGGATIRALLFGDRYALDSTFMDRIRRAGLAHSLALSGLHLALVAGFGFGLAWIIGRIRPGIFLLIPRQKLGLLLALPLVLTYVWMGDYASSLLRACVMLLAATGHYLLGAKARTQDSLLAAAGLLVACDPHAAFDLSLQLSVLAVAGIVLFMPPVAQAVALMPRRGLVGSIIHGVLVLGATTFCANLFLLPVQTLYFTEVPRQIWLNLLWLPVLSCVVLPLSFAGLMLALLWPAAGAACFSLAALGVDGLDWLLAALDQARWLEATVVLRPHGLAVVGYWVTLLAGAALLFGPRSGRRAMACLGIGLGLLAFPAVWTELGRLQDRVELTVLDTGMSQAVVIRGTSGRTVLVDGGGAWNTDYDPGRALVGPALVWNHPPRLETVALTHLDADHVRGLFYVLDKFRIERFVWTGLWDQTSDSARLAATFARSTWPVLTCRAGDRLEIDPGLWLDVLHPQPDEFGVSENETSLVLRLVWHGRGLAVLPGDAEKRAMRTILASSVSLDSDVLILPHHGSKSSLLPDFYDAVNASWAVAACGPGNRFGFPHPDVVAACRQAGSTVLTTADHGAVRFVWTAGGLSVRTARQGLWPD